MRKLTQEQIEKAAERRQKMRELAKGISKMPVADRVALAQRIPVTTIEGRTLSVFNNCFVAHQNQSATIVGGFRQWKKAGRTVKKGERGLAIWIPVGIPKPGQEGEAIHDGSELRFMLATVFDVSQTSEIEEQTKEPVYGALDESWGAFAGQPVLKQSEVTA